jgi:hypothetical protein
MSKKKYNDFPFDECTKAAHAYAKQGCIVIQKWTCAGCGARLQGSPFHWTENGRCDEADGKMGCGHVTNIRKQGCNYMLMQTTNREFVEELKAAARAAQDGGILQ